MKIKIEYIILVIVIAALSFYLTIDKSDRTHYELPVIAEVPQATVTKMVISEKDYKIELVKKDNSWLIQPQNYLSDPSKVKSMLNAIEKMTLTALISESGPYERYHLSDDKKIHLAAWAGDKIVREFDIGKPASSNQHTFFRLDKDSKVFHIRGNLRQSFDFTVDQLRDKNVLSFDAQTIQELTVNEGETPVLVASKEALPEATAAEPVKETKQDESVMPEKKSTFRWVGPEGTVHDEASISEWLSVFSNLKCDTYLDKKTKADFADMKPLYTVQIKGNKAFTLTVFDKETKESKSYPGISSENDHPFLLPDWKVDSIKSKIEGLKKPAADKKG